MHTRRNRAQYKHSHEKTVYSKPHFVPIQRVFVDKSPSRSGENIADKLATASYNKLRPRKAGLFFIVKVQSHTVVIDEDDVSSTVSTHRTTTASTLKSNELAPMPRHAQQSESSQMMSDSPLQQNDQPSDEVTSKANPQVEYAVEQIAGHKGYHRRRQYIVRWYRYRPEDAGAGGEYSSAFHRHVR